MKKGITMLLVLALSAMMLVGCGGGVAGTYKISKVKVNDKEMELDALAAMTGQKYDAIIVLREDGIVQLKGSAFGDAENKTGKWEEAGDKIIIKDEEGNGQSFILTVDGDRLYMDSVNGMQIIMEK